VETAFADPQTYFRGVIDVLQQISSRAIEQAVESLLYAYEQNRTVYVFGNGGSAALASHVACDLGKGTRRPEGRPFRILSLADNVPLITAWANDANYEDIFAEQLRSLMVPGDVAFAISGSGNSPNVLNALRSSRGAGGFNMGLTGRSGGKMRDLCDVCVTVPAENMQQIEDSHLCVMHAVFIAFRHQLQANRPSYARGAAG
jgi:D-sedoheptulose 7-phosphate isomerase